MIDSLSIGFSRWKPELLRRPLAPWPYGHVPFIRQIEMKSNYTYINLKDLLSVEKFNRCFSRVQDQRCPLYVQDEQYLP